MNGAGQEHSDLVLARAVLRGDERAREEFATRMDCVVKLLAARNARMGTPFARDDLLDLAQEVQLLVWRKLPTFEGRAALETWVYRFCQNVMRKALENRRKRKERFEPLVPAEVPEPAATAEVSGEGEASLALLLRHLTERESRVTYLRHVDGLEFAQIAEVLGISTSSAKTHYYRSLEKLRAVVGPRERAAQ